MEANQHELYENARNRINQKKLLFYHFMLFLIGSVFLFVANKWLSFYPEKEWWIWAVAVWLFLLTFHAIKVFIIDGFLNKDWERKQIDKLILLQTKKVEQLKNDLINSKASEE